MKPSPLFLSSLILILHCISSSSTSIPLGSSLSPFNPSKTWNSPNSSFSVTFIPASQNPPLFQAAITYSGGIPVWTAGPPVDSSATFRLLASGDLCLLNSDDTILWQTTTAGLGVTSANLLDSGDLQLTDSNFSPVWQSFLHPTDTLVETQNLTLGLALTSGLYSFALLHSGDITLTWNDGSVVYYNEGFNSSMAANSTLIAPSLTLDPMGILYLSDPTLSFAAIIAYWSDNGETVDMLRFVRLDADGNLRMYSSRKGSGTASNRWSLIDDQCRIFGYCGKMGVCSYNNMSPVCGCPSENFMPSDPYDARKGCKPKIDLKDCPGNETMLELDHTLFLTYPPELSVERFFTGITACKLKCLSRSSCAAMTSLGDGSGRCYLKYPDFVSGYQSTALPSTSFVKVCIPAAPNQSPSVPDKSRTGSSGLSGGVIAIVVVGTIIGLGVLESALWWFFCRNNPKSGPFSAQYALLEYASGAPVQFSYNELHRSTKGFEEKLGAGGFGAVYKGVLANRTVVAVKQLEGIEQGEKQFRMEVATISSTNHLNLVRLIGFCSEGRHRLLIYEFMKNGSLDSFLFFGLSSGKLAWPMRFSVAIGTARGITYLHEECRDCIVHCDIKPENILLDEHYNAKVSDFGLAKLINLRDHSHQSMTSIRGTRGYLAPEWLANHPITSKSDVFSYGMVLLEIVSGRRNFDVSEETGGKKFSIWAYEEFVRGNIMGIMDKRLVDQGLDMQQIWRAVQVSFWCVQEQPSHRPSMGKVVQMLEGIMEIERPPAPKAIDGSQSVTSGASSFTVVSGIAAAPVPSLSSSLQATPGSSSFPKRNLGGASSSLFAANESPS